MRRLLTLRMVALHVVVLAVVVLLSSLGAWQVRRLAEVTARTDAFVARLEQPEAPAEGLLDGLTLDDTEALAGLELRLVTATGVWRPEDEVLQRGRSYQGRNGYHLLTPLDLADGRTIVVRRGWVPFDNDLRPPVAEAEPRSGEVVVHGFLERSIPQPTGPVAQRDPDEGRLQIVFNPDLDRLGLQLANPSGGEVLPMLLHLESQEPPRDGELPIPAERPALDNGPHLSYAIQWYSFATIALGMYLLWLRRRLRGDERAISPDANPDAGRN